MRFDLFCNLTCPFVFERGPLCSSFHVCSLSFFKRLDLCGLYCRIGLTVKKIGVVRDGTRAALDRNVLDVCIKGRREVSYVLA